MIDLLPGERLVAVLACLCGYRAVVVTSEKWGGPVPVPSRCPDCGAVLVRSAAPPSGGSGDASGR
jgi:hypothetical protein